MKISLVKQPDTNKTTKQSDYILKNERIWSQWNAEAPANFMGFKIEYILC